MYASTDAPKSSQRAAWEVLHKGVGWFTVLAATLTVIMGITIVGAPRLAFGAGYGVALCLIVALAVFLLLEKRRSAEKARRWRRIEQASFRILFLKLAK